MWVAHRLSLLTDPDGTVSDFGGRGIRVGLVWHLCWVESILSSFLVYISTELLVSPANSEHGICSLWPTLSVIYYGLGSKSPFKIAIIKKLPSSLGESFLLRKKNSIWNCVWNRARKWRFTSLLRQAISGQTNRRPTCITNCLRSSRLESKS